MPRFQKSSLYLSVGSATPSHHKSSDIANESSDNKSHHHHQSRLSSSSSANQLSPSRQQQQEQVGATVLATLQARYSSSLTGTTFDYTGYSAESWSFLFSLPHLIMMSNLQSFFGSKNAKKPSIQPNEYMDGAIANMKATMQER